MVQSEQNAKFAEKLAHAKLTEDELTTAKEFILKAEPIEIRKRQEAPTEVFLHLPNAQSDKEPEVVERERLAVTALIKKLVAGATIGMLPHSEMSTQAAAHMTKQGYDGLLAKLGDMQGPMKPALDI